MQSKRWWGLLAVGFLGSTSSGADGLMIVRQSTARPEIGHPAEAGVGGAIYHEEEFPAQVFARLLEDVTVTSKGDVLKSGTLLQGEILKGRTLFCSLDLFHAGPWRVRALCLIDHDLDGRFGSLHLVEYRPPKQYPIDVGYQLVHVQTKAPQMDTFRRELVYLGSGGGVLRLAYREYVNGLAREAFGQDATYNIGEGPTEVTFKGARIEVVRADNTGITYRVLEGFAASR